MFNLRKWFGGSRAASQLHMKPQAYSSGRKAKYSRSMYSTQSIRWVSAEQDQQGNPKAVRMPAESFKKFCYPGPFTAAGKTYETWDQLCRRETATPGVCTDIYGRPVFCDAERFPCFDSDDFLYENRFYRWFFILEKGKITRVFYTDECKEIDVTEDVANIEDDCLSELGRLPFGDTEAGKDQNRT